jgi:hypothetical protein
MTTLELRNGHSTISYESCGEVEEYVQMNFHAEAARAVGFAREVGSYALTGIQTLSQSEQMSRNIQLISHHVYSVDPYVVDCHSNGISHASVTEIFKEIDAYKQHRSDGLILIKNLDNLTGTNVLSPSDAQERALARLRSCLEDEKVLPRICAITSEPAATQQKRFSDLLSMFGRVETFGQTANQAG